MNDQIMNNGKTYEESMWGELMEDLANDGFIVHLRRDVDISPDGTCISGSYRVVITSPGMPNEAGWSRGVTIFAAIVEALREGNLPVPKPKPVEAEYTCEYRDLPQGLDYTLTHRAEEEATVTPSKTAGEIPTNMVPLEKSLSVLQSEVTNGKKSLDNLKDALVSEGASQEDINGVDKLQTDLFKIEDIIGQANDLIAKIKEEENNERE